MNYRHAEILASENLGNSGTKIIPIEVVDPISRLTICFQPTGGSATPVAHPVSCIEKIELIDGSDALYNLTGFEGHALNIFDCKKTIMTQIDYRNGGVSQIYVHIDFGRWLWDKMLAFIPGNFKNPQLKITWNEVNFDASCTSHTFTVYAHVFDEKAISPVGFLTSKEIKAFEPSSGSYEYTNLPIDLTMRKLIIQGLKLGAGLRGLVQEIRLSEDNDKRIPISGDVYRLTSFLGEMQGDCVDKVQGVVGLTGQYIPTTVGNFMTVGMATEIKAQTVMASQQNGSRFFAEAETGDTNFVGIVRGRRPHCCMCIPFGLQDDIDDWYDVTNLGSLKLRLKGGTSSASGDAVRIVTQQLRRY